MDTKLWYAVALVIAFWVVLFTLYEKRKNVRGYKNIHFSLVTVTVLAIISILAGGLGYKLFIEPPKEEASDPGLLCRAEVRQGKIGDVKSEYFISENHSCDEYIEYKNTLPDDTEIIQVD